MKKFTFTFEGVTYSAKAIENKMVKRLPTFFSYEIEITDPKWKKNKHHAFTFKKGVTPATFERDDKLTILSLSESLNKLNS